ncbi:MAG: hypothetical protein QOE41_800, partial [Mycobacterium sp.]|nr:hypothetical protein [Mycobacterium sp.]
GVLLISLPGEGAYGADLADLGWNVDGPWPGACARTAVFDGVTPGRHLFIDVVEGCQVIEWVVQHRPQVVQRAQ